MTWWSRERDSLPSKLPDAGPPPRCQPTTPVANWPRREPWLGSTGRSRLGDTHWRRTRGRNPDDQCACRSRRRAWADQPSPSTRTKRGARPAQSRRVARGWLSVLVIWECEDQGRLTQHLAQRIRVFLARCVSVCVYRRNTKISSHFFNDPGQRLNFLFGFKILCITPSGFHNQLVVGHETGFGCQKHCSNI